LNTDQEFSFGEALDGAKFKFIDFWRSGRKEFNDFTTHPERLSNILKALGEVEDVRENLQKIMLRKDDIKESKVVQMLKDSNLGHVEVYFYKD
jgi:hypothetical protein